MEFIQRRVIALLMSLAVGIASVPALADMSATNDPANERPSGSAMFTDAIVARPMLIVLTAVGTATFLVTLPFSALGGNVGEAAHMLVVGPAKAAFMRCLGCTESQDRWKHVTVAGSGTEESASNTSGSTSGQ